MTVTFSSVHASFTEKTGFLTSRTNIHRQSGVLTYHILTSQAIKREGQQLLIVLMALMTALSGRSAPEPRSSCGTQSAAHNYTGAAGMNTGGSDAVH